LAGLGALGDTKASCATTTGIGDAERTCGAILLLAACREAGAVAVTTTAALMLLACTLEAIAVAIDVLATVHEGGGTCTWRTLAIACCESFAWDQGSQCRCGRNAGRCFHCAAACELPIGQSLGYAFEPVCHYFLLVFTVWRV